MIKINKDEIIEKSKHSDFNLNDPYSDIYWMYYDMFLSKKIFYTKCRRFLFIYYFLRFLLMRITTEIPINVTPATTERIIICSVVNKDTVL